MYVRIYNHFQLVTVVKVISYVLKAFMTHNDGFIFHQRMHVQSDPFVEISKAQEGGEDVFTVVYRSQPIKKTLNPQ